MKKFNYKEFGVDINLGEEFIKDLKPLTRETFSPLAIGDLGGFSGCFEIPNGYKDPILCASTDGVGSKLKLAIKYNQLEGVGIDLVAMCVNDLICDFATPLFFLDYYACHKLDKNKSIRILKGIVDGCKIAKCSLIGGETAEMPSVYRESDFDLAGFSVGIAQKSDLMRKNTIKEGDEILAIPSNGFHSNGYSLIQGIIEKMNIDLNEKIGSESILSLLLKPTRIYVNEFLKFKNKLKGIAHITGGGLEGNIIRILNEGFQAVIDKKLIKVHEIFNKFTQFLSEDEKFKVFNMGIGMIFIVDKEKSDSIVLDSDAYKIGTIQHISSGKNVILKD